MANLYVSLLVSVPESSRYVGAGQKFPVLLYVDPDDANIDVCVHTHTKNKPGVITVTAPLTKIAGPFNRILWIDNLPEQSDHTLCIEASDPNKKMAHAIHRCKIRREIPQNAKGKKPKMTREAVQGGIIATPPTICYPTDGSTVKQPFTAYGYVTPATDPVSVWLVDGNNNVFPGAPVVPPPAPYDWAVSFNGIPTAVPGGTNYTLNAEDTNTGKVSSIDITVQ